MKRRLFIFATATSLLLFFSSCATWICGYWRMPAVQWTNSRQSKVFFFFESRGHLELIALGTDGYFPLFRPGFYARMENPLPIGEAFCFSYFSNANPLYRTRHVIIPMWAPTGATLALPILWVVKTRQLSRRKSIGLCIDCGYDLRANTSGRCPECGTFCPQNNPATPGRHSMIPPP